jgi:ferredoxin--NADP+ reductase
MEELLPGHNGAFNAAVIGAGPAGIFAARELAQAGVAVTLFNRDIKPGGLAEYGIYPTKTKMKDGLRVQFRQILAQEGLRYQGNVTIGQAGDGAALSLDDLRGMGFDAILATVGAQGTKWLGLPGEDLRGVYHAKDLVYHYNHLPPFSAREFDIGKRAAVIGVGNVMLDITHWLLEERGVDEVIAVARRGPAEVKFDKKELEYVVRYLDLPALETELERLAPEMARLEQNPDDLRAMIQALLVRAPEPRSDHHFRLEFLASPARILGDESGRVRALEVEETTLERKADGETSARGTGHYHALPVDTVIFAIGDRVDPGLGLALKGIEFAKNPAPRFPQDGLSFEAEGAADVFVAGWARQASYGLVGVARRDGTLGAKALLAYLQTLPAPRDPSGECVQIGLEALAARHPVVTRAALERLDVIERKRAQALGRAEFRFDSNEKMLRALGMVVERE